MQMPTYYNTDFLKLVVFKTGFKCKPTEVITQFFGFFNSPPYKTVVITGRLLVFTIF